MAAPKEVEIKFFVSDLNSLARQLFGAGFYLVTPSTHEANTLYDLPGQELRWKGELLRLRKYGERWWLTHKSCATPGRHKSRVEVETAVDDGKRMDQILRALGYQPVFAYEKYRSEWSDSKGHVVLDHTPIGDVAEIEGPARWIDRTAKMLGVAQSDYITQSYVELFFEWKRKYKRKAMNMTFRECGGRAKVAINARNSSAEAEAGSGV